ncbi:hypothetical protein T439DRAFT_164204 [Meredithblackwellia eburnea MCA 4105]
MSLKLEQPQPQPKPEPPAPPSTSPQLAQAMNADQQRRMSYHQPQSYEEQLAMSRPGHSTQSQPLRSSTQGPQPINQPGPLTAASFRPQSTYINQDQQQQPPRQSTMPPPPQQQQQQPSRRDSQFAQPQQQLQYAGSPQQLQRSTMSPSPSMNQFQQSPSRSGHSPNPSQSRPQSQHGHGNSTPPPPPPAAGGPPPRPAPTIAGEPLHDMSRAVSLLKSSKFYAEGFLMKRIEATTDGKTIQDSQWTKWFVQLTGTIMSTWNATEMEEAARNNRTVPPQYLNLADTFLHPYPPNPRGPPSPTEFQFALNSAGLNRILFCANSLDSLTMWINAIRLAVWERSRCNEIYTGSLLGLREPRGGWVPPDANHRLEGWLKARLPGDTEWRRTYVVLLRGAGHGASASNGSTNSVGGGGGGANTLSKKQKRTSLLSFGKRRNSINVVEQPLVEGLPGDGAIPTLAFFDDKPTGAKGERGPLCIAQHLYYVSAVFPESEQLIDQSSLFKVEGTFLNPSDGYKSNGWGVGGRAEKQGFALLMLDEGDAYSMLNWIVGFSDAFKLYGRPRGFSYDPRDPSSMYFALPVGPHRDRQFLDRELVDTLKIDESRPRAIRAVFHNILFDRMRGVRPAALGPPPATENGTTNTNGDQTQQAQRDGQWSQQQPPLAPPARDQGRNASPNTLPPIGEQNTDEPSHSRSASLGPSVASAVRGRDYGGAGAPEFAATTSSSPAPSSRPGSAARTGTPNYLGDAGTPPPPIPLTATTSHGTERSEQSDVLNDYSAFMASDIGRDPEPVIYGGSKPPQSNIVRQVSHRTTTPALRGIPLRTRTRPSFPLPIRSSLTSPMSSLELSHHSKFQLMAVRLTPFLSRQVGTSKTRLFPLQHSLHLALLSPCLTLEMLLISLRRLQCPTRFIPSQLTSSLTFVPVQPMFLSHSLTLHGSLVRRWKRFPCPQPLRVWLPRLSLRPLVATTRGTSNPSPSQSHSSALHHPQLTRPWVLLLLVLPPSSNTSKRRHHVQRRLLRNASPSSATELSWTVLPPARKAMFLRLQFPKSRPRRLQPPRSSLHLQRSQVSE